MNIYFKYIFVQKCSPINVFKLLKKLHFHFNIFSVFLPGLFYSFYTAAENKLKLHINSSNINFALNLTGIKWSEKIKARPLCGRGTRRIKKKQKKQSFHMRAFS